MFEIRISHFTRSPDGSYEHKNEESLLYTNIRVREKEGATENEALVSVVSLPFTALGW